MSNKNIYSSVTIANQFIFLAKKDNKFFTPMQLLKLVYIAHGFTLALYDRPLTNDEIEAWSYGPVIPKLYNKINKWGDRKIKNNIEYEKKILEIDQDSKYAIESTYKFYGNLHAFELSDLTHQEDTPWHITIEKKDKFATIDNKDIKKYYDKFVK